MNKNDLINMINDANMTEADIEYFTLQKQYYELFGHNIPREMISPSATDAKIIELMKKSIDEQKDILSETLVAEIDLQCKY